MLRILTTIILLVSFLTHGQELQLVLQTGNKGKITALDFHSNRPYLLSADNESIVIWNLSQKKQYSSFNSKNYVLSTGFYSESEVFIATSKKVTIWNFVQDKITEEIEDYKGIKQVDDLNDGLVIQNYNEIIIYDVKSHTEKNKYSSSNIKSFELSTEGNYIGITESDTYVLLQTSSLEKVSSIEEKNLIASHISDAENKVLISSEKSSVKAFSEVENPQRKYTITNDRNWHIYNAVAISDHTIVVGDENDIISIIDNETGRVLKNIKNNSSAISALVISKDESLLAVGGLNGRVNLYELKKYSKLHTFESISPNVTSMKVIPSTNELLLGYDNGIIKKWNLNTHQVSTLKTDVSLVPTGIKKATYTVIEVHEDYAILEKAWYKLGSGKKTKEFYIMNFDDGFNTYTLGDEIKEKEKIKEYSKKKKTDLIQYGEFKIRADQKGFIHILRGEESILRLVSPESNSFFYITNDNYYFASKSALKYVGARYKNDLIGFEQIDLILNRPDKVITVLNSDADQEYIDLLTRAYEKRLQKLGIKEASLQLLSDIPTIQTNLDSLPIQVSERELTIHISANSNANLKALHVLVNEVPIYGKSGKRINGQSISENISLKLSYGINKISVYVESENGLKSIRESATITLNGSYKPAMHILAIGANKFRESKYDLNYARKDAEDLTNLFEGNKNYDQVYTHLIASEEVTKENVFNTIKEFSTVGEDDVILVFYAGHGVLDENLDYFLSTSDMDFMDPSSKGISFDLFEEELSKLPCRNKMLMIDACHSGELDKDEVVITDKEKTDDDVGLIEFRAAGSEVDLIGGRSVFELSKNLFADLRSNSGVVTISSAGAAEYALEGTEWKNGAFTYCLLEGIRNMEADLNRDKRIDINELQTYIFEKVPELTGGRQTPTSRVELLEKNFFVW
ncbi:MAG: caspase family protein [Crocinitomicaceae bacterium]|nr:caspase family protein [Crocinitomicaceae bacterium]